MVDFIFAKYKPDVVVNLAAQAGVRYSITNPDVYIQSNLIGFIISLKPAVILMTTGSQGWSIWYMLPVLLSMERTRKFPILQRIRWTIRFPFMQRPRSPMS